jgi:hypothetical protein
VFGIIEFCYIDKWWSEKSLEKRAIGRSLIACVKRWDVAYSLVKLNQKVRSAGDARWDIRCSRVMDEGIKI